MMTENPKLIALILAFEHKLASEGLDPKQRAFELPIQVLQHLGYKEPIPIGGGGPEILGRVKNIHATMFKPKDTAMGAIHAGCYVVRGIVSTLWVPQFFGTVSIDPLKFNDLTEQQKFWLVEDEGELGRYNSAFADVWDLAATFTPQSNYTSPKEDAVEYFRSSAFHLQAASASLASAYDSRGAIQSALLGTELALKAGLREKGVSESRLVRLGHRYDKICAELESFYDGFKSEAGVEALSILPDFISNRYKPDPPSRLVTGDIVMSAQFLAAEISRKVTKSAFLDNANPC